MNAMNLLKDCFKPLAIVTAAAGMYNSITNPINTTLLSLAVSTIASVGAFLKSTPKPQGESIKNYIKMFCSSSEAKTRFNQTANMIMITSAVIGGNIGTQWLNNMIRSNTTPINNDAFKIYRIMLSASCCTNLYQTLHSALLSIYPTLRTALLYKKEVANKLPTWLIQILVEDADLLITSSTPSEDLNNILKNLPDARFPLFFNHIIEHMENSIRENTRIKILIPNDSVAKNILLEVEELGLSNSIIEDHLLGDGVINHILDAIADASDLLSEDIKIKVQSDFDLGRINWSDFFNTYLCELLPSGRQTEIQTMINNERTEALNKLRQS